MLRKAEEILHRMGCLETGKPKWDKLASCFVGMAQGSASVGVPKALICTMINLGGETWRYIE